MQGDMEVGASTVKAGEELPKVLGIGLETQESPRKVGGSQDSGEDMEQPVISVQAEKSKDSSEEGSDAKGRIFVAKIPRSVTEEEFEEYFSAFGPVNDAYMPRDRTQRYFRGIGFITFESEESANKVMAIKHRFHDQDVVVDFALPPKKQRTESDASGEKATKENRKDSPKSSPPAKSTTEKVPRQNMSTPTSVLSKKVIRGCSISSTDTDDTLLNNISAAKLPTVIPVPEPKAKSKRVPSVVTYNWPQVHGLLEPMACSVQTNESFSLPAHFSTPSSDFGSGTCHSGSRDFSFDGSLRHSHSFSSNTDGSSTLYDGSPDFLSSGSFSLDSELTYAGHNQMGLKDISPMSILSHDDLYQAFQDLPYASSSQSLQQIIAMHAESRSVGPTGLYPPENFTSHGKNNIWGSKTSLGGFEHLDFQGSVANDVFLSDTINKGAPAHTWTHLTSFQNWQREYPKVCVGCIPKGITKRDVSEYFRQFGRVHDVYVSQPWETSENGGFGFVSFQSTNSVQRVAAYGLHRIKNCPVSIDATIPFCTTYY